MLVVLIVGVGNSHYSYSQRTCLVFIAAMLGFQGKQLDAPLTVALISFAVAIPMLVFGFLLSAYTPKPVRGWLVLAAVLVFAWAIEAIGGVALAVGVFAVIAHLSPPAFRTSLWISISIAVGAPIISLIGLLIYGWQQYKKEQKKQKSQQ